MYTRGDTVAVPKGSPLNPEGSTNQRTKQPEIPLTPAVFCQNPPYAAWCIAIHPLMIHLRRFAGFSPGKLWFSSSSPSKRPPPVFPVRVMMRYGK